MSQPKLLLVSHVLCPYVQRAVIALTEKGVAFERRDIDLANKPAWFLALSPLGKTPVLVVDGAPIFESAVIVEYLEETQPNPLHPAEPLARARHRSWIEFSSVVLNDIAGFYAAPDEAALAARAGTLASRFAQVEAVLGDGPYFAGERFSLVDAAFAAALRYFDVFDRIGDFGVLSTPKVQAWRAALRARASVQQAVAADYSARLEAFLRARGSALARRMPAAA